MTNRKKGGFTGGMGQGEIRGGNGEGGESVGGGIREVQFAVDLADKTLAAGDTGIVGFKHVEGDEGSTVEHEESHLIGVKDVEDIGDGLAVGAQDGMFLEVVAKAVGVVGIVSIQGFHVFDRFFMEVDDIVQQIGVFDDPQLAASFESFVAADMRFQRCVTEKYALVGHHTVRVERLADSDPLKIPQPVELGGIKGAIAAGGFEIRVNIFFQSGEELLFFMVFVQAVAPVMEPDGEGDGKDNDSNLDQHFL